MNLKQIKIGQWYQTKELGEARCMSQASPNTFIFETADGTIKRLSPASVKHEIAKGEEPDDNKPAEVQKNRVLDQHGTIKDNTNEARIDLAESSVKPGNPVPLLKAALHALRSYQHGNGSPALAEEVADVLERYLLKGTP